MASKFWIKLYHEILDDPKMGQMIDRLWRRTIELFLLAGDYEKDGLLPPVHHIAWRLRLKKEELETDLRDLLSLGILEMVETNYRVVNFAKRQEPVSSAERSRRYRQRKRGLTDQEKYGDPYRTGRA